MKDHAMTIQTVINNIKDLIATKKKHLQQWRAPELLYGIQSRSDAIMIFEDSIAELEDILRDLEKCKRAGAEE